VIDRAIPLHTITSPLPTVTHRYFNVTHRSSSFLIVSYRFFTVSYRFEQLFPLPEFFGNNRSEKHIKNTKQSNKTNNKYTLSVFGASYGYSRYPLVITMRSYLGVT